MIPEQVAKQYQLEMYLQSIKNVVITIMLQWPFSTEKNLRKFINELKLEDLLVGLSS